MDDPDDALHSGLATVNRLTALLAEETRLIAAGNINEALALAAEKAGLAAVLSLLLHGLRAQSATESTIEPLRDKIEAMQETLAVNLAVLATARSVSEALLRDVSRRLTRPLNQPYGPRKSARVAGTPLVLSRAT